MGNNSPSRYRREGRAAFYPGSFVQSEHLCPYTDGNPTQSMKRSSWLEGWNEESKSYRQQEPERKSAEDVLTEIEELNTKYSEVPCWMLQDLINAYRNQ